MGIEKIGNERNKVRGQPGHKGHIYEEDVCKLDLIKNSKPSKLYDSGYYMMYCMFKDIILYSPRWIKLGKKVRGNHIKNIIIRKVFHN